MRLGKTNTSKLDCFTLNFHYICIMYVSVFVSLYEEDIYEWIPCVADWQVDSRCYAVECAAL